MRVFIAGATGAIGAPLARALCTLGHQVIGMTRAGAGVDRLRELGAKPFTADAFDPFVHIDDAVAATVASLTAEPGAYNVVDDDPLPVSQWLPAFARWVDAEEPPRLNVEDALKTAG